MCYCHFAIWRSNWKSIRCLEINLEVNSLFGGQFGGQFVVWRSIWMSIRCLEVNLEVNSLFRGSIWRSICYSKGASRQAAWIHPGLPKQWKT